MLGYLYRLLAHGSFNRAANTECYEDAFGIFGAPAIFKAAAQPDMPEALKEVMLSLDEYEVLDRSIMQPTIERHINQLLAYLRSVPVNAVAVAPPVAKLFEPDRVLGG